MKKFCKICNKKITKGSKSGLCKSCCQKGNKGRYIDGRSLKKNFCVDCGKEINWQSERCPSCATKCCIEKYGHPMQGRKHTKQTKLKQRNIKLGKKHTIESKEKMSKSFKGRISWNKGLTKENNSIMAHVSSILKGRPRKDLKGKKRPEITGKNHVNFGKHPRPAWLKYNNKIKMRSSWEVKYAKYLDRNNIKWLYEPKFFDLGIYSYCPDFYLPKTKKYIEIKGYWSKLGKEKFRLFKELYPKENIEVLMKKELINKGVI